MEIAKRKNTMLIAAAMILKNAADVSIANHITKAFPSAIGVNGTQGDWKRKVLD